MRPGLRGREGACGAGRSMNPNSRRGTSPHRGAWVMDVETMTDRFVGIDVSKAQVPTRGCRPAQARLLRVGLFEGW